MIGPQITALDRRFHSRLRALGVDDRQRSAIREITPGSAASSVLEGQDGRTFSERVEHAGRLLARFNLPPTKIAEVLNEYDALLTAYEQRLSEEEQAALRLARQQLLFSTMLAVNDAYFHVREVETRTLHEIFRIDMQARNVDVLYRSFIEVLATAFGAEAGHVFLFDATQNCWQLAASTATAASDKTAVHLPNKRGIHNRLSAALQLSPSRASEYLDAGWVSRYASVWSFPMKQLDSLVGVVQFGFVDENEWLPRDEQLMNATTERCLIAAERARLVEELAVREEHIRRLAERMMHVEEMERRRMSRELHDDAGQSLVCIRLQMELIEMSLPEGSSEVAARLAEVRDVTEKTILDMRRLIADLSPVVLEQFGLEAAIRQPIKRLQALRPVSVKLTTSGLDKLPQNLQIIVYRIVQECCNNVGKHSKASNVNISVTSADGVLRLEVIDDGTGFEVEEALQKTDSFGLAGIRERVALLGGKFAVHSRRQEKEKKSASKKGGTEVLIELPLTGENGWQK